MVVFPPKILVENNVTTKASYITHDACRIFGSLWKTKKIPGKVIASEKRIPAGSTRNATFITVELTLPGRIVLKELNRRLVEYTPPSYEVYVAIDVVAAPDATIDAITDPIPTAHTDVLRPISTSQTIYPPPTTAPPILPNAPAPLPMPPLPHPVVDYNQAAIATTFNGRPPPPPSLRPVAPVPAPACFAQEVHGRIRVINDRAIKFDVNGPIPHYQWYISDSLGERIMQYWEGRSPER